MDHKTRTDDGYRKRMKNNGFDKILLMKTYYGKNKTSYV